MLKERMPAVARILDAGRGERFGGLVLAGPALAVAAGLVIARGGGLLVGAFAAGVLLLLLSGLRLPRILGLTGALLLIPNSAIIGGVSAQNLLVAGEVVLASAVLLGRGRRFDRWVLWSAAAFVVLLGFSAQRAAAAGDTPLSPMQGFFSVAGAVALVAAGACRRNSPDEAEEFARVFHLWGIPLALWAMAEFLVGRSFAFPLSGVGARAVGPFGNPNYFGLLLAELAVLSFALALVLRARGKGSALPRMTGVLCSAGVLATFSRGAMFGLVIGLSALIAQGLTGRRKVLLWATVAVALVALGPLALRGSSDVRLEVAYAGLHVDPNLEAASTAVRVEAASLSVGYALEHPWTGVGLERFAVLAAQDPRLGVYANTHNEPLRVAAEVGLPAFALMIALVWMLWIRIRRQSSMAGLVVPLMACYGAASLLINGLDSAAATYPVVAAMFLAAGYVEEQPERER